MKEPGTSSYESLQDEIRNIATPAIEVFKNIYQDRLYRVSFSVPEFSAICPKTSLPDYGKLLISYYPDEYCIELKSFKEYILFYRNIGIFQENAINRIKDDFVNATQPRKMQVHLDYNVRGGIITRVSLNYQAQA